MHNYDEMTAPTFANGETVMAQDDLDFSDLESDLDNVAIKKPGKYGALEKYPCIPCAGTGKYTGVRVHQEKAHCFNCKGQGYFLSSPEKRAKNKTRRDNRKAEIKARELESINKEKFLWINQHPDLFNYLVEVQKWNGFASSLLEGLYSYGTLTENQVTSAKKMWKKHLAKSDQRTTIDLTRIWGLFNTALSNGLAKPRLRVDDLIISIAPSHGMNAGSLYVKLDGEYQGKLLESGKWCPRVSGGGVEELLIKLAEDPLKQAIAYGMRTGACSCCGRRLTNKTSVELGIGPICKIKWGM